MTLFDSGFLPQGLALYRSLQRHMPSGVLWVLCMDERAHEVLSALALPRLRLIRLEDVETPALQDVRKNRTRAEYCWTLTPHTPRCVFAADSQVKRVTYVDADVWFVRDPMLALKGFLASEKAVQITEHAFAEGHDKLHIAGRFCVQFMTFARDRSDGVRQWWEDRCLEWCYARWEDGRFGDQMYLEDWPTRFPEEVHVLAHPEQCQGPWNLGRFRPADAVMYHFHGLRLAERRRLWLTSSYRIGARAMEHFYRPYARDLASVLDDLARVGCNPAPQVSKGLTWLRLVEAARRLKQRRLAPWSPMTLIA